ncbi:MAG: mechanosensitive ion channel family protein [Solirubrobacterales bacterium]
MNLAVPHVLAIEFLKGISTGDLIRAAAVLVGGMLLAGVARGAILKGSERAGAPTTLARLFSRTGAYLIAALALFYALSALGIKVGPLIGALGVGGIAIAFAIQEILSNFVAGILLQLRRPIKIGDQIVSNEHQGTVTEVNLRVVEIKTFDGEAVFIPNSMVLQNPITNWTRTPTRRTTLAVGIAYDDDVREARQAIADALATVDEIETNPEPQAFLEEFGDNSVNFAVRFWHKAEIADMWKARDAAAEAIKYAFDGKGISFPFPQRTLWFGPGNTELSLVERERSGQETAGSRSAGDAPGSA